MEITLLQGIIITLVAQIFVSSSYSKYKKVRNKNLKTNGVIYEFIQRIM